MRLTLHTDYALRVLVCAGLKQGALVTINEIAAQHGISKNHLTKVVHQLGRFGYLETVRGKYGGVRLMGDPADIRLGQFVRRIEDDFAIARCLKADDHDDCHFRAACVAKQAFTWALDAFFATLDRYTLADMIAGQQGRDGANFPVSMG